MCIVVGSWWLAASTGLGSRRRSPSSLRTAIGGSTSFQNSVGGA